MGKTPAKPCKIQNAGENEIALLSAVLLLGVRVAMATEESLVMKMRP